MTGPASNKFCCLLLARKSLLLDFIINRELECIAVLVVTQLSALFVSVGSFQFLEFFAYFIMVCNLSDIAHKSQINHN